MNEKVVDRKEFAVVVVQIWSCETCNNIVKNEMKKGNRQDVFSKINVAKRSNVKIGKWL